MFSPHPIDQQVSPCYHSFLTVSESYDSKVTHSGAVQAEKIAEAVLFYVLRITYPGVTLGKGRRTDFRRDSSARIEERFQGKE